MITYEDLTEERRQVIDYAMNMLLDITDSRVRGAMAAGDKTTVIKFTRDIAEDILEAYAEKLKELGYTFTTKKTIFGTTKFIFKLQGGREYDYENF